MQSSYKSSMAINSPQQLGESKSHGNITMNWRYMHKIAVIGGDGTGPEVINEGLKALDAISKTFNIDFDFQPMNIDGTRYLKTGELLTDADIAVKACDAIYLGAIGHPDIQPGILERHIIKASV